MNLNKAIEEIKVNEGFREHVYPDTLGHLTIGYGFALKDLKLDKHVAEAILRSKITDLIMEIYERMPWFASMPDGVQSAILDMCYQLGLAGFMKFKKTIHHLIDKDWERASQEVLNSKYAMQTPARAKKVSEVFKKGI